MRSPKQRSRSKQNRPRTLGNIINRVFDSSGPEGKVRGTPQQIIEKYQVLARDAQLSNDRVAAENFQQHAEHYTRLLAQAQREMQAEAEARRLAHEEQQQHQQRHRQNNDERGPRHQNGNQNSHRRQEGEEAAPAVLVTEAEQPAEMTEPLTPDQNSFALVDDQSSESDNSLVETPEARRDAAPAEASDDGVRAERPARPRGPRRDSAPREPAADNAPAEGEGKPRRNQRRPRKPAADDTPRAAE